MDITTHYRIARRALESEQTEGIRDRAAKALLLVGTAAMDLSPMRFKHRHFYNFSRDYTYEQMEKLISKLQKNDKLNLFNWFCLGGVLHYMMDYFCQVHQDSESYEAVSHMIYEKNLNRCMREDLANIKDYQNTHIGEDSLQDLDEIASWVESLHAEYLDRDDQMEKDLAYAMFMTVQVFDCVRERELQARLAGAVAAA
ncbi:MAG: zinc dependent phospholipase C family protein [Lachnospiraceae bacterium]|nr:zinc dependent phospholipase C family protein [Lachnospiraceae bacterium]